MDDLPVLCDDDDHAGQVEQPGERADLVVERPYVIVLASSAGRRAGGLAPPAAPSADVIGARPVGQDQSR